MLYEAATWRPTDERQMEQVLVDPGVALYLDGWGRDGDAGVVAERSDGRRLGASWYRLFRGEEHGYGFIDAAIPEVTLAVAPEVRGRGVGAALLDALCGRARAVGFSALSLSVERENPALRLYERTGFVAVREVDGALTMRLDLD